MISVIIPCYNKADYLEEAIKSVIDQTFKYWDIIIINDSSNNDLNKPIKEVCEKYSDYSIDVIRTNNIGATKARHLGIMKSNNDFYMPLDPDDKIQSVFLDTTLITLEKCPNVGFAYVDTVYFAQQLFNRTPSLEYSLFQLIQSNFISYCSLFRKAAYVDIGGYDLNNFCYLEDYQLYLRLGAKGWYGKHIASDLFYYRVREDSSFQSERRKKLEVVYRSYIISQLPNLFPYQWQQNAKDMLLNYPHNFMSMNPQQQEKFLREME